MSTRLRWLFSGRLEKRVKRRRFISEKCAYIDLILAEKCVILKVR